MQASITADVRKILGSLFGYYRLDWAVVDGNDELTGMHVGLAASDMVYLLCEVERQFDISLSEKDLSNYGFSTINGIVKVIAGHLKEDTQ